MAEDGALLVTLGPDGRSLCVLDAAELEYARAHGLSGFERGSSYGGEATQILSIRLLATRELNTTS